MPVLPVLLVAGLLYAVARSQTQVAAQVKYQFTRVVIDKKSLSLTGLDILTTIKIINPSNGSARVNALTGEIYSGSQYIGQFNYLKPFDLAPRGEVLIEVRTTVDTVEAGKLIWNSLKTLKIPTFTIKGFINTPAAAIPMEYTTKPVNV